MVKRLIWLAAGVAVGVVVVRKLARGADALSPAGIGERLKDTAVTAGDSMRNFMADVAQDARDKEAELHNAIEAGESIDELLADDVDDDR